MIHADSAREINEHHKQQKLSDLGKEPIFDLLDKDIREAAENGIYTLTYKMPLEGKLNHGEIESALYFLYSKGRYRDICEYLLGLGYDVQMTGSRLNDLKIEISW